MPTKRPVPSAASASFAASAPPAIASDSGASQPLAPLASTPNSRSVRGDDERARQAARFDQRHARRPHEAFTLERGRDALGGGLGDRHARIEPELVAVAACIRVRLLCFVASARAENPPQHIIDAMSSIAAGVRNARYLPGASDFAGRDM